MQDHHLIHKKTMKKLSLYNQSMMKFENIFVYLQLIILIAYKALLVIFKPYKGIPRSILLMMAMLVCCRKSRQQDTL